MELNARRKAMKKKSSTRQAAQDPRSSTQVASSSCTPRDVGGLENLNPNMPSLYAYNPQQNAQGVIFDQHVQRVDTPSSNGVAFYGYNPQRNVQGLVLLICIFFVLSLSYHDLTSSYFSFIIGNIRGNYI
ncbi:uncharacterized protein LOC119999416 isoform X1 [Tripterygium wilfordii]|uniref:uncharacterized protein LOC119999416 isoform X1 n=1 Tax=Tripterygium wilfordii TaxID=458696 RepID=UPI0018F83817|nr:uncharacterized protein LOC119999416 isoform X1 [Tripterygium wilfordii]